MSLGAQLALVSSALFVKALLIEGGHYRWKGVERPPLGEACSSHSMLAIKNSSMSKCRLRVQEENKTEGGRQDREKVRAQRERGYLNTLSSCRSRNSHAMAAMVCNQKRGSAL